MAFWRTTAVFFTDSFEQPCSTPADREDTASLDRVEANPSGPHSRPTFTVADVAAIARNGRWQATFSRRINRDNLAAFMPMVRIVG